MSSDADERREADVVDVLILGASLAGVEVLYQLHRREGGRRLRVAVVDRQREHSYIPLVQERLCRRPPQRVFALPTASYVDSLANAKFVQDEVRAFDVGNSAVELASGARLQARFVVVALGSVTTPPAGVSGADHLLTHKLEPELGESETELDAVLRRDGQAHIVVVGGGITGVELAAELAHLRYSPPSGWRPPRVTIVESGARLLVGLSERAANTARRALVDQGVDVRLRTRLVRLEDGAAFLSDDGDNETTLELDLAFWAGGVRPAPVLSDLGLPTTPAGWLAVGPTLQCFPTPASKRPDVFACGDAVEIVGGSGSWRTMRRAIECLWQAKLVARNVLTLAAEAADYPDGVPPLQPHVPREDFPYGVSLGRRSLIVYRNTVLDVPGPNLWFRRFLMRQYFRRYDPRLPQAVAPSGGRAG